MSCICLSFKILCSIRALLTCVGWISNYNIHVLICFNPGFVLCFTYNIQCKREGFLQRIKDEEGEGCNIYGFLEVNKVAGNFHFAPGKSFQQSGVHVHDLLAFQKDSFNVSHDFTSWLISTYGISISDLVFAKENELINFFLNAHHAMVSKLSDKCTQCDTDKSQN